MSEEMMQEFLTKHKEYSIIASYPPFSISLKKKRSYLDDLQSEENRILSKYRAGDDDAFDRMFSTLDVKWQDDLEEAKLYQKRYNEPITAQKEAIKLNNLDPEDWDVPLEP